MKCVVSGATGFIGGQLCQQLVTCGHTVIALSKSGAPLASGQSTIAVDLAECDLDDTLLQGVDVVFHLAGVAHQRAQPSAYTDLNYRATERLARLASAAGVGCFIYLSSVKAMGLSSSSDRRAESACTSPTDAYGRSKWQAESALREGFSTDKMSIVIIRPVLVYGPQAKGNLQALAAGVRWGLPRPANVGRRSMIALDDLVDLLCVIADRPPQGVQTWVACGQDSYSTREVYDLLRTALGKGRGVGWLPHWVWRWGANLKDTLVGRNGESTYEKLFGTELYSNAAVKKAIDWRPSRRLEDFADQLVAERSASK